MKIYFVMIEVFFMFDLILIGVCNIVVILVRWGIWNLI